MTALSHQELRYLTALRHDLHRFPEVSGEEVNTAARIAHELEKQGADRIFCNIGGHGVAAEFRGVDTGPTVLFRCELDALPITEISNLPYRSEIEGKAHLCGHDGHMCMTLGIGMGLAQRPQCGRVILLFQPAEETGFGAQAVINDPRWDELRPDYAFACHNLPGRSLGEICLRDNIANCASRGMQILLEGKSSHAAAPDDGVSPARVMAELMQAIPQLGQGSISDSDFTQCTLTFAKLGEPTFGISPGIGELRFTLRSRTNARIDELIKTVENLVRKSSAPLKVEKIWHDIFPAVKNDEIATDIVRNAANASGLDMYEMPDPLRWSEDFGHIGDDGAKASLIFIGSGENQPQLHNPDFDFPDALLSVGSRLGLKIVNRLLGKMDA